MGIKVMVNGFAEEDEGRAHVRVNRGREGRVRLGVMSKFSGWKQAFLESRISCIEAQKVACQAGESLLDIIRMASVEIN